MRKGVMGPGFPSEAHCAMLSAATEARPREMTMSTWLRRATLALLATPVAAAWGQGFTLPDGPGKDTVAAACAGCHPINRLGAGYSPEGWRTVVRMMQNLEVPLAPEQWASVTDYLIKAFPERPKP